MNKMSRNGMLLGAGALAMYFFDPDRGRGRRVQLSDALRHCRCESRKFAGRFRRDLRHRVGGAITEARLTIAPDEVTDQILMDRVRSALGHIVTHPHAVEVHVKNGCVELGGRVMAWEAKNLRSAVQRVRGVRAVSIGVQTAEGPLPPRKAPGADTGLFGNEWSPTARVLTGGAGVALIVAGILQRRPFSAGSVIAGALMAARAMMNMPLRRVPGAGIHIEKTMHVRAPREEVFTFWSKPENYAQVFSHVKAVEAEGEGVYRWHVSGPAGIPLSWAGTITEQIPPAKLAWSSLPGTVIENSGIIRLDDEGDGRTRVHVRLEYKPPAGLLGHSAAKALGVDPRTVMHHDLAQLQSLLERGYTRAHGERVSAVEMGLAPAQKAAPPVA